MAAKPRPLKSSQAQVFGIRPALTPCPFVGSWSGIQPASLTPPPFSVRIWTLSQLQILDWFIMRWGMEVTFQESRTHLGLETQRQWSDLVHCSHHPCLARSLFSGHPLRCLLNQGPAASRSNRRLVRQIGANLLRCHCFCSLLFVDSYGIHRITCSNHICSIP